MEPTQGKQAVRRDGGAFWITAVSRTHVTVANGSARETLTRAQYAARYQTREPVTLSRLTLTVGPL
jgi:hypothetical protein